MCRMWSCAARLNDGLQITDHRSGYRPGLSAWQSEYTPQAIWICLWVFLHLSQSSQRPAGPSHAHTQVPNIDIFMKICSRSNRFDSLFDSSGVLFMTPRCLSDKSEVSKVIMSSYNVLLLCETSYVLAIYCDSGWFRLIVLIRNW